MWIKAYCDPTVSKKLCYELRAPEINRTNKLPALTTIHFSDGWHYNLIIRMEKLGFYGEIHLL